MILSVLTSLGRYKGGHLEQTCLNVPAHNHLQFYSHSEDTFSFLTSLNVNFNFICEITKKSDDLHVHVNYIIQIKKI